MRFVHSYDEFKPYVERGLIETILSVEKKAKESVFETPQTVSWERVSNKLPRIYYDLIEAVEAEKKRFA